MKKIALCFTMFVANLFTMLFTMDTFEPVWWSAGVVIILFIATIVSGVATGVAAIEKIA